MEKYLKDILKELDLKILKVIAPKKYRKAVVGESDLIGIY